MASNRCLIVMTLAASLLTLTGGVSSASDSGRASGSTPAVTDSVDLIVEEGMGLDTLSIGGGFDIDDSGPDLMPYFISGGVMAALAVTQLSVGGDSETGRQYDVATGSRAGAPALPFEGTTPPHWPLPGAEPPGWTRWGSNPPGWTISGADPPSRGMHGDEPPGQSRPREEHPGWLEEPPFDPLPVSVSNEVPEPGMLLLFGSSLLCVLGVRAIRRR